MPIPNDPSAKDRLSGTWNCATRAACNEEYWENAGKADEAGRKDFDLMTIIILVNLFYDHVNKIWSVSYSDDD